MSVSIIGLDIGGANIKASMFSLNGSYSLRSIKLHYPIWIKGLEGLSKALRYCIDALGADTACHVAITMTAELADIFKNKREGVKSILSVVKEVFPDFKVITCRGELINPNEAVDRYMDVAAANWWTVGWFASKLYENCVVVDIGSTTTTITPIINGKIVAKGLNDVEKLCLGEIVYVGALRTPISSITPQVPVSGTWCRTSSEYFANTGDVNLILGLMTEDEYDIATPNGRGKSLDECFARLSRAICGDDIMLTKEQIKIIAKYIYEKLIEKVFEGLIQVLSGLATYGAIVDTGLAVGLGDFIAKDAIERAGLKAIALRDLIGRDNTIALTSASLALYLASKMGVDVEKWISSLR